MEPESIDSLPLTEASFQALEAAYEREWCQAQLMCEAQTPCIDAHVVAAASRASEDIGRLWADTARLHRRFLEIEEHRGPSFTHDEHASLRLLGFRSPTPPRPSSAVLVCTAPLVPPWPCATCKANTTSEAAELGALRNECAKLRQENANLMTRLAWYHMCESHAARPDDEDVFPRDSVGASSPVSDAYGKLAAVQRRYTSLFSPRTAEYSLGTSDCVERAEDVAIAQLLFECAFPPQVRVARLGSEGLFMVDRPVWIGFASLQSATLIVRDPEGVEENCTLESYLMTLYAPLLEALHWQKPSTGHATSE
ncbi:hypothetical protein JKF63_04053 [Porcisia hertigi]|uniref:Uncharacterized protein n=1 Tax=Porcisia hertigi TaxID=2761500 RepID=A0A836L7Y0_9TRYP|nr:hypothetical protein JKF63_04053 [Porcisia hertigi]